MSIFAMIRNVIRNLGDITMAVLNRKFLKNFNYSVDAVPAASIENFSWIRWFKGEYRVTPAKKMSAGRGVFVGVSAYVFGNYLAMSILGASSFFAAIACIWFALTVCLYAVAIDMYFQAC